MSHYFPHEEQENMSNPGNCMGRSNRRGNASARAWEESLDDVVSQTDESIEKLKEMQRPKPKQSSQLSHSSQPIKSLPLTVGTRARSVSTSRASTPTAQAAQNKETDDTNITLERKVEFLFRRTKMLDEKLRFAEKEKLESKALSQDTGNMIAHLAESYKADQKQMMVMRDNIATLKGSIEVLTRRERAMATHMISKTHQLSPIELEVITESVTKKMKNNFTIMSDDISKNSEKEQSKFLSKWAEKATTETDRVRIENNKYQVEIIPAVEKEVKRMIIEFSRLKGRQDSLEGNYHTLQSAVNLREKKAEDAHRKVISSYKQDMSGVMDNVGKRMNEYLSVNVRSKSVGELSDIIERQSSRLDSLDAFQRGLSAHNPSHPSSSSSSHKPSSSSHPSSHSSHPSSSSTGVPSSGHNGHHNDPMNSNHNDNNNLNKSEQSIIQLRSELREYQTNSSLTIEEISNSNRRIKGKVNELSAAMASVSKIREAVEVLLSEVNVKNEAQDNSQVIVMIKGLDSRLAVLERNTQHSSTHSVQPSSLPSTSSTRNSLSSSEEHKGGEYDGLNGYEGSLSPELQETLARDLSRMQSELEDTVKSGWADITARNTRMAQEGVKLGEVVQRLQGVVLNIQNDQEAVAERVQGLENRYIDLEEAHRKTQTANTTAATTSSTITTTTVAAASHAANTAAIRAAAAMAVATGVGGERGGVEESKNVKNNIIFPPCDPSSPSPVNSPNHPNNPNNLNNPNNSNNPNSRGTGGMGGMGLDIGAIRGGIGAGLGGIGGGYQGVYNGQGAYQGQGYQGQKSPHSLVSPGEYEDSDFRTHSGAHSRGQSPCMSHAASPVMQSKKSIDGGAGGVSAVGGVGGGVSSGMGSGVGGLYGGSGMVSGQVTPRRSVTEEENGRMNITMLASLTDSVYKNTDPDSAYRPLMADTSTSSVTNIFDNIDNVDTVETINTVATIDTVATAGTVGTVEIIDGHSNSHTQRDREVMAGRKESMEGHSRRERDREGGMEGYRKTIEGSRERSRERERENNQSKGYTQGHNSQGGSSPGHNSQGGSSPGSPGRRFLEPNLTGSPSHSSPHTPISLMNSFENAKTINTINTGRNRGITGQTGNTGNAAAQSAHTGRTIHSSQTGQTLQTLQTPGTLLLGRREKSFEESAADSLRSSVSLDDYLDTDSAQKLHQKKNQHRSQFLKMVMSKK